MPIEPANTPDSPESLPALSAGLKAGFAPRSALPGPADEALRRSIHAHFAGSVRRRPRRFVAWSGAIAAIVGLAVTAWVMLAPQSPGPVHTGFEQLASDVDGDGSVDILDAFALARMLEARQTPQPTLDINGDGAIDERDVDTIAMQAVSISRGSAS